MVSVGARSSLVGYVDGSLSCSTMLSTSSSLSSNVFCVCANFRSLSSMAGSVVVCYLVFLVDFASVLFSLSSIAASLPIRSAMMPSI